MTSNGSYMNGYDVLVAKYIAEKLDMDLEITQIDWDGLILSIQSEKLTVRSPECPSQARDPSR